MTPERWREIEVILQAVLDRPVGERAALVDKVCAGDDELKREAVRFIASYTEAGDFLEQPAMAQDAGVLFASHSKLEAGSVVGRYEIVRRVGAGGMGDVYLASDARLGRGVALKILPAYFVTDEHRVRRFHREARAASALNHPNILTIHEVGESDDVHFIATEYVDGQTLRELITNGSLELKEILDIAVHVASALAAAHTAGIIHRDIKPENIMRRTDRLVKVLDFGIAKLTEHTTSDFSEEASTIIMTQTEAGARLGTVGYMSPEQARGQDVDARTDIWSFGVVLYEMLALRQPFLGATQMDTLVAILEREPPPLVAPPTTDAPDVFEHLHHIIFKALRKDAGERYATATEMLADLNRVKEKLELAAMLERQAAPNASHTARDASSDAHAQNEKSDAFPSGSPASSVPSSSPMSSGINQRSARKVPPRSWVTSALIGASILMALMVGAFFYQRIIASRVANVSGVNATAKLYRQMNGREQLAFIDEQERRISGMMGDRRQTKLDEDALRSIKRGVDRYVARLGSMSDAQGSEDLRVIYARALPFVSLIRRSFAEHKVPVVIGIYLPMIESEYKTCLESSYGAKGMFQFMPKTAKNYGVAAGEMCDVEKMTPAAAHYIADRMAELGDDAESMTLVVLSYNRGTGGVLDALRRLRNTENYERNFWTLYAHRDELDEVFREENAGYVPMFFAAAIIGENPETFELQIPALSTFIHDN